MCNNRFFLILLILLLNVNIIISQHKKDIAELKEDFEKKDFPNLKHYPLKTLAYITPWNKEGYNYVEKYSNKFDIISPTWFELKPDDMDGELQIILDGSNNIDSTYMKKLRSRNKNILILPRLHTSFNDINVMETWFTREAEQFVGVLERRIKYNKFDGYVFDCMQIWFNKNLLDKFIKFFLPKIYEAMNKLNKIFILTIIPKNLNEAENIKSVDKRTFRLISNYVHYFNIMTYDYHQYNKNNPNYHSAPISWIKETINYYVDMNDKNANDILKKILIGIPFHGYSYQKSSGNPSGVITGTQFAQILEKEKGNKEINSDEEEGEYTFESGNNVINYPGKEFIKKRLEVSKELNIGGIGIWDVGNGKESLIEPF